MGIISFNETETDDFLRVTYNQPQAAETADPALAVPVGPGPFKGMHKSDKAGRLREQFIDDSVPGGAHPPAIPVPPQQQTGFLIPARSLHLALKHSPFPTGQWHRLGDILGQSKLFLRPTLPGQQHGSHRGGQEYCGGGGEVGRYAEDDRTLLAGDRLGFPPGKGRGQGL